MNSLARIRFFENQVHNENWKKTMSGNNEDKVIEVLEGCDFVQGKDFVRQYPIGEKFVLDFAFVNEQIAIEVDGKSHRGPKQQKLDKKRDSYLRSNDWAVIRIDDEELFGFKLSFYKNLIKEIVLERRDRWEKGDLFARDIPNYKEEDYV